MNIEIKRTNGTFHFIAGNERGNTIDIDASAAAGGSNSGMSPMELLPAALGGCNAIDVIIILQKQKQEIQEMNITVDAERETGKPANLFTGFHIHYKLKGNLDKTKVEKAIALSLEKYCSVAKTLEKTAKITFSFETEPVTSNQ